MKKIVLSAVLLLMLPAVLPGARLTLKEDADLLGEGDKVLMTMKKGERFKMDRVEGDWVVGSYMHESGIARGRVRSDAFVEQALLRKKMRAFLREMEKKGMVKHEGKWIEKKELERIENEEKGLVEFEGKWMTPEERDTLIAEREAEDNTTTDVEDPFGDDDDVEEPDGDDDDDVADPFGDDDDDAEEPFGDDDDDDVEEPSDADDDDDDDGAGDPGIVDLTGDDDDSTGDGITGEIEDDDGPGEHKREIDWEKTTKENGGVEKAKSDDRAAGSGESDSAKNRRMSFIILGSLVGMGIIMVLIVVLSAKRGSRH